MAILSCVIRKASSPTVVSAAVLCAITSPRILCESHVPDALCGKDSGAFTTSHHFSTDTRSNKLVGPELVKVLRSELKSAKQLSSKNKMPEVPADFPFTLEEDSSWNRTNIVILERKLPGETIKVFVHEPLDRANRAPWINLDVLIVKPDGRLFLEFEVSLYGNGIKVNTMHIEEVPEPTDSESEEDNQDHGKHSVEPESDLQFALREFLNVRGIKETHFEFLYKYMIGKCKHGDMLAMEKLKTIVKRDRSSKNCN